MRAAKKDINHKSIQKIFIQFGYITIDTSSCHGKLLDFIAYKKDQFWFIEVKNGNKKLTEKEIAFCCAHQLNSVIIRSIDDAINFCNNKNKC